MFLLQNGRGVIYAYNNNNTLGYTFIKISSMDSIVSISMFVCSFFFPCWFDQSMSCRWGSIQFTLSIQTVKLSLHHGLHSQANRVGFTYPIQYKNKSVKPSTSKHLRFFLGYPVTRRRSRKKPKLNNPLKIREKTTHWSVTCAVYGTR